VLIRAHNTSWRTEFDKRDKRPLGEFLLGNNHERGRQLAFPGAIQTLPPSAGVDPTVALLESPNSERTSWPPTERKSLAAQRGRCLRIGTILHRLNLAV
jgi:hypothetical protein